MTPARALRPKFWRTSSSRSIPPKPKAPGLGLAISYTLVEQQDGVLEVESEVGRGSIFTVRLPSAAEEHVTDQGSISQGSETQLQPQAA